MVGGFEHLVRKKISSGKCSLCALAGGGFVPTTIPDNIKVLVVGEAPGADEVKAGVGFVGRSGKLLRDILFKHFKEDEVGFTNICHCRPSDNRTPKKDEIDICTKTHLIPDIMDLPDHVVLLAVGSSVAVPFLTGGKKNALLNFSVYNGHYVMSAYHPASHFYGNKDALPSIEKAVGMVKQLIDGMSSVGVPHTLVMTSEEADKAYDKLKCYSVLGTDIETTGLDYFENGFYIHTIAFSASDEYTVVFPIDHSSLKDVNHKKHIHDVVRKLLEDNGIVKVFHNAKYDVKMLAQFNFNVVPIADTMLQIHLINDREDSKSLKALAPKYVGKHYIDIPQDFKKPELKPLAKYNAMDAHYTVLLFEKFNAMLSDKQQWILDNIMYPTAETFSDIERNGIKIDVESIADVGQDLSSKIRDVERSIFDELPGGASKYNLKSNKQLQELLFDVLKYPVIKFTNKGSRSTDAGTLKVLAKEHKAPVAKKILEMRKYEKLLGTYVKGLREHIKKDGRIHPDFSQTVTRSYRSSCSNPNLQNIPRNEKSIKNLFVPDDGHVLLNADLSQIELRIIASLSLDPVMLSVYKNNGDIHATTAQAITGKEDWSKEDRSKAKCVCGDTLICTNKGLVRARDLVKSRVDGVFADSSCGLSVSDGVSFNKIDKEIFFKSDDAVRVTTKRGLTLDCSSDHPFVVLKDGKIVHVLAKDLSCKDNVLVKVGAHCFGESDTFPSVSFNGETSYKDYTPPKKITEDIAYFLGIFAADGSISKRGHSYAISIGVKKPWKIELIDKHIGSVFGDRYSKKCYNGVTYYRVSSKAIYEWLLSIGSVVDNKKMVPSVIFSARKEIQTAFIRGMFDFDGCVTNNGISLVQKSKQLIDDIVSLLLNLGIFPRQFVDNVGKYGAYYKVRMVGYDAQQFMRIIGSRDEEKCKKSASFFSGCARRIHGCGSLLEECSSSKDISYYKKTGCLTKTVIDDIQTDNKTLRYLIDNNIWTDQIKSVMSIGKQAVYDVVAPETKLFVTNGFITVDCVNFGLCYGQKAAGLKEYAFNAFGVEMSLDEAELFRDRYFNTYKNVKLWHDFVSDFVNKHHRILYPNGKVVHFPEMANINPLDEDAFSRLNQIYRSAVNYPVQGTGWEILAYIMCRVNKLIKAFDIDARIVNTVHDSIVFSTKEEQVRAIIGLCDSVIKSIDWDWLHVPIIMDFEKGDRWGELEEIKIEK